MYEEERIRVQKNFFTSPVCDAISLHVVDDSDLTMIRSLQTTEFRLDDMRLNLRYGFYNKDYPNKIRKRDFVLDFDCFVQEVVNSSDGVIRYIAKGHNAIQTLFERSITDKLRSVMNDG